MPIARSLVAALALAFTAISCTDDKSPTGANTITDNQTPAAPTAPRLPRAAKQPLLGSLAQPQTFLADGTGSLPLNTPVQVKTVQITKFYYENGQLLVDGGFFDQNGAFLEAFSRAPAELTSSGGPTAPVCPILTLDIGAIHLDLLGLVVDLAPVNLDVTAESGPGNLLGNLLCALVGLLDQTSPLETAITNLLNTINNLLSGLLGSV
jgi:hypothetical protein